VSEFKPTEPVDNLGRRTVRTDRLWIGLPRQDDLIRNGGDDLDWLRIDITLLRHGYGDGTHFATGETR
jgi:hypothetical protein